MSTPVTEKNGKILWHDHPVVLEDFAAIREYVDACLNPAKASTKLLGELTTNFELLIELVDEVDHTLPWATLEQDAQALESIPAPPKEPVELFPPRTYESGLDADENRKSMQKRINHQEELIAKGYSSMKKSVNKLKHQLLLFDEFHEKHGEWKIAYAEWESTWLEYKKALPDYERRVKLHEAIRNKFPESVFKKQIIARIRSKLHSIANDGGIIFEQLPWKLLPSGEPMTDVINRYTQSITKKYPSRAHDSKRITKILSLKPDKAYIGHEEFDGYIVFIFDQYTCAVLECPWLGNALYLLDKNHWGELSKLSKSVLLNSNHVQVRRLIHDSNGFWFTRLKYALKHE